MAEEPNIEALAAYHAGAVDKIIKVLIDETIEAGGDVGDIMGLLVSVIACTVLNLFRTEAVENALAQMNEHIGPRMEAVRQQNAETLAKLEEATRVSDLRQQGRLN